MEEELEEQKPAETIGKKKKSENMELSDAKVIYEFIWKLAKQIRNLFCFEIL